MTTRIAFHSQCPDGFTAAWIAWHYYRDRDDVAPELHPARYGDPIPDGTDEDVVILDFSYPPADLVALCERARSVTWLDHHASAIDAWFDWCQDRSDESSPDNLSFDLDLERSGALITWDFYTAPDGDDVRWYPTLPDGLPGPSVGHFELGVQMAEIVARVDDRDRWQFAFDDTAAVFAALTSRPYTIDAWDEAFSLGLDGLVTEGRSIVRYRDQLIDQAVASAYRIRIAGHMVHVANVPYAFGSDVAGRLNELHPDEPFSGYWFTDGTEQKWGLRSGPAGADVSKIAARFGGGGHVHAAGFRLPDDETAVGRLATARARGWDA